MIITGRQRQDRRGQADKHGDKNFAVLVCENN